MAFIGGKTDGPDGMSMTAKNNELFAVNRLPFSDGAIPSSGGQSRHVTAALCPGNGSPSILASCHSRTMPSALPLTTIVSSGDTAIDPIALPSLRQGFPTCSPYLFHWRIEPSSDALTIL